MRRGIFDLKKKNYIGGGNKQINFNQPICLRTYYVFKSQPEVL